MKHIEVLFQQGEHRWVVVARDKERANYLIDTNEYLVSFKGESLLTDPGGMEIFPGVFAALSQEVDINSIQFLFASHQDPDIISSLALWLDVNPNIRCYLSWLWSSFIPHFGGDDTTFIAMPDEGMSINLNGLHLQAVPAHYLHSSGNFQLYDPIAKLLFSGDVGAAIVPVEEDSLFVEDFDKHIKYAEKFHQRWMGSNEAKLEWCERAANMNIDLLCPQHGSIYQGSDVMRFINWFSELRVGVVKTHSENVIPLKAQVR